MLKILCRQIIYMQRKLNKLFWPTAYKFKIYVSFDVNELREDICFVAQKCINIFIILRGERRLPVKNNSIMGHTYFLYYEKLYLLTSPGCLLLRKCSQSIKANIKNRSIEKCPIPKNGDSRDSDAAQWISAQSAPHHRDHFCFKYNPLRFRTSCMQIAFRRKKENQKYLNVYLWFVLDLSFVISYAGQTKEIISVSYMAFLFLLC